MKIYILRHEDRTQDCTFFSPLTEFGLRNAKKLINVLKGEMSLIGPRPLLSKYLSRYNKEQSKRHNVKPGITGWAQVNGRNAIDWEEKFKLDVEYVEKQSFLLDIRILLKTFITVINRKGISAKGQATMGEFLG